MQVVPEAFAEGERKGGRYPIKGPTGRSFEPAPNKHWRDRREDLLGLIQDGRVYFGEDGASQPNLKRFLSEVQQGVKTRTIWDHTDVGSNDSAKRELRVLFPGQEEVPFSYPKPSTLSAQMLKLSTQANEGDVILDFFAGSCTTAQAVLELNREDGGSRRFIMVQLPEPVAADLAAGKAGYRTMAGIGKERIRRVIARLEQERQGRLDLTEGDLLVCRDCALDDETAANLALQCRLKTI